MRRLTKRCTIVALLSLLCLVLPLLLACAAPQEATPTAAPTTAPAPTKAPGAEPTATPKPAAKETPKPSAQKKYGGVIRLVSSNDPVGWEPHGKVKVSHLNVRFLSFAYDRLLQYGTGPGYVPGNIEILPDLAEKWEQPDAKTYVFYLAKGTKWHNKAPVNGREFVAEDVKWTFDRLMKQSPENRLFTPLDKIEVLDKYTIKFTLKEPFAPFITNIAGQTSFILAEDAGEKTADGGRDFIKPETLIGTGAFMLDSYQTGVKAVYKKNSDYREKGLPYLDGAQVLIVPDDSTKLALFRAAQVDALVYGYPVTSQNYDEVRRTNPNLEIAKELGAYAAENIAMRTDVPPFNNLKVRQAVSMALDREGIKNIYFRGHAEIPVNVVPVAYGEWALPLDKLGDAAKYYKYDVEAAKKLLAEAGYPTGFQTELHTSTGYGADFVERTELLKDYLSRIGIDAKIIVHEYTAWIQSIYAGKYDGMIHIPRWGLGDPDEYLHSYYPGDTRNHSHVDDAKLNQMIDAQRAEANKEKRIKIALDMQLYLAEQAYRLYLPLQHYFSPNQPWVKDLMGAGRYDVGKSFRFVWLDK